MSIKAGIGASDKPEARTAGVMAAKQAVADAPQPEFFIVFCSSRYDQAAVIEGVKEVSGDRPIAGCTAAGEITPFGVTRGAVTVMAMAGDGFRAVPVVGGNIRSSSEAAGYKLGQDVKTAAKDAKALLFFTDILKGDGDEIGVGIKKALGRDFLIFGAAAGDNFDFKETFTYLNGRAYPTGLAGLALTGSFRIGIGARHGWVPIGLPVKITKAHEAVVDEIDGRPAVQFYVDHFGLSARELMSQSLPQLAITYPLGAAGEGGEHLIRYPMSVNRAGGLRLTAGFGANNEVRLMLGSRDEVIRAAEAAAAEAMGQLGGKSAKAALVFCSVARSRLLAQHADEEIERIKSVIGPATPFLGFYSFGEYAPVSVQPGKSETLFHNETATVVVFGE